MNVFELSDELVEARFEKSAAAYIAINKYLQSLTSSSLVIDDFLRQYEELKELEPEAFTRVWTDPVAYWWLRVTFDVVQSLVQSTHLEPGQAKNCVQAIGHEHDLDSSLEWLLNHFSIFYLSALWHAGSDTVFEHELTLTLPVSIPGSNVSLKGEGALSLLGIKDGCWVVRYDGEIVNLDLHREGKPCGIQIKHSPVIEIAGEKIYVNNDFYLNVRGLGFASTMLDVDDEFVEQNLGLIEETLGLIEKYTPDFFARLMRNTQVISLKPYTHGDFTNMAYSDLPGSFALSVMNNPYELADTIIHEFHHNVLFAAEEQLGDLFDESSNPVGDTQYYSPWRPDPRGVFGIMHGAYVYTAVNHFWSAVVSDDDVTGLDKDYAKDRLARAVAQVYLGVNQLREYAKLESLGEKILTGINASNEQYANATEPLEKCTAYVCDYVSGVVPEGSSGDQSVMTSIINHIHSFSPENQKERMIRLVTEKYSC